MDIARDKSMFWHGIWRDCGRLQSGVVYSIKKKTRSTYHYMLRTLKKKKKNIARLGPHSQNQYYELRIRITGRQLASNAKISLIAQMW